MKNKSLILFLLVFSQWSFSQTFTTGVVNLSSTAGLTMSVKLDISTNVTMTLTGPSGRWFALGFGASSMAAGTDVVGVHALGSLPNFDANLTGNNAPATDTQQDWTITSDQVAAGVRTIIATRALNTGDANDYTFTAASGTLSLIWARGSSNSFAYSGHGNTNRGVVNATFTLSTVSVLNPEIEKYKVYPTILACGELLHLPSSKTYNLYDLQGNLICSIPESISELRMDFPAGLYLLKNDGETIKIVLTK